MSVDLSFITAPSLVGLSASVISGASAGRMRVTGLTGMTSGMVGQRLGLIGSTNSGNIGIFPIAAFVNATTVDVTNANAVVTDAGPLQWIQTSGASNAWVLQPSGNDAKDSPNIQFALLLSQLVTVAYAVTADLALGPGTFYCRTQMEVADWHGTLHPQSLTTPTTIIAGTVAGGPMDFLSDSKALLFNDSGLPDLLVFYGKKSGIGTNTSVKNLAFATNPSSNANSGLNWFFVGGKVAGNSPWDNFAVNAFIHSLGIMDSYKAGVVTGITAPDGSNKQTLTSFTGKFKASDVGRFIYNYDSPKPQNNGKFLITDYVDSQNVKFVNAVGAADTGNNIWSIMDQTMDIGRCDVNVDSCTFTGDLGSKLNVYNGQGVYNVGIALDNDTEFNSWSVVEGTSTAPFTLNSPILFQGGKTNYYIQYATRGGRFFWFTFSHQIRNGTYTVNNCQFVKCGMTMHVWNNWNTNQNISWLNMPANAVQSAITVSNNTMTDCGLLAFAPPGSFANIGMSFNHHGPVSITGNSIKITSDFMSNQSQNRLAGINIRGSDASWIPDPTVLSLPLLEDFDGGSPTSTWSKNRPAPTWYIANNTFDMGVPLGNAKNAGFGIFILSPVAATGLVDFFNSCVIAHNSILGGIDVPIFLRGVVNVNLAYNTIQGPNNSSKDIVVLSCANVQINNNTYLNKPKFNVYADTGTKSSSWTDTIGQGPAVLDLGSGNSSAGYTVSTDPTLAPTDPTAGHGTGPNQ